MQYAQHYVDDADIEAVVDVMAHRALTQGELVTRFENAVAQQVGATYAIAANSGTSALHAACVALHINAQSRVWTVPNSFAASANAPRYCGATVDFVDIDPDTHNLCFAALHDKLIQAERENTLPDALIVVHFAGLPVNMAALAKLKARYGFAVIEDAAHALGAFDGDAPIGSCRYSDLCVFSFHPVKSITAVEGGMVCCHDPEYAQRARLHVNHGITRDPELLPTDSAPWYYEQQQLGYNYRLSDVHAALGLSQLKKLPQFMQQRQMLVDVYHQELQDVAVQLPARCQDGQHANHLFVIKVAAGEQQSVYQAMLAQNIRLNVHYLPIHLHPYYRDLGFTEGMFVHAEDHAKLALTLPLYVNLTPAEVRQICHHLRQIIVNLRCK
jgi:UDP-4-amino-4,6-dideoxy-N-acetyl-beta-L-altrosamine transaminase